MPFEWLTHHYFGCAPVRAVQHCTHAYPDGRCKVCEEGWYVNWYDSCTIYDDIQTFGYDWDDYTVWYSSYYSWDQNRLSWP